MSSKYEKTQGTKISISKLPATEVNPTPAAEFLQLSCAAKEVSYTGGQKSDIDVTTLCSTEQEMTNGLASPGEVSISGNWSPDEGQEALRAAYDNDTIHVFKVEFPSGNGYAFLAEVRQNSWSAATSGLVTASFTLRMKGKPVPVKGGAVVNLGKGE
ncbi:phage tail protein [Morganella morganii]|uniref:phage tail tube protein n=1 Tax=Morganella morganii TaxID=582 RepID=UPI000D1D9F40|nr:phage tail tube protein [Morganella morganii]QXO42228.1 phage tail protein [Morganella morganii]QXO45860.1 phage tail protein [Morganella morganii]QXO49531.1 phage tail protein [Morganella morganii]QXO53392.1 phage tail protein [Morganella morganii]QXO80031.1 phage tail protein [Morganella morganii]